MPKETQPKLDNQAENNLKNKGLASLGENKAPIKSESKGENKIKIDTIKEQINTLIGKEGENGNESQINTNINRKQEETRTNNDIEKIKSIVEEENGNIIEQEFLKFQEEGKTSDKESNILKKVGYFLYKQFGKKAIKYLVLPASVAAAISLSYKTPNEYLEMYQNYKEKHIDKEEGSTDKGKTLEIKSFERNDSLNKYKEIHVHTPNFTRDPKTGKPLINEDNVVVIHHTGPQNAEEAVKYFENKNVKKSAHVVIAKNGTRYLFNEDNYVLAHAGKSIFKGRSGVNYFALGVEMEGDSQKGQFTVSQIESLIEYLRPRIKKYNIPLDDITTHKIIRMAWIKKHPNDKKVYKKYDLDDLVWLQIRGVIEQKIYGNKDMKPTEGEYKMFNLLEQQSLEKIIKNRMQEENQETLAKHKTKGDNKITLDWTKDTIN